jgi:hypothetical protein
MRTGNSLHVLQASNIRWLGFESRNKWPGISAEAKPGRCRVEQDSDYPSRWRHRHVLHIGCVPEDDSSATFGFLDPAVVIRASHLVSAYHHGRTTELLGPSINHADEDDDTDWRYFYVGM